MPFSRLGNKEKLIEAYRPMGIKLYPIMFEDEVTAFNEPWIFPVIIPMRSTDFWTLMPGCFKRNWFIKHGPIFDEDYYVTVDDDDMYEPDVMNAIKQMDDDIVIISMKRGYQVPKDAEPLRRYPIERLLAQPDYIQEGAISAQQSFVKGKIFKQHLHNEESHNWDGELAVHHKESGEKIVYRPDLFALFNYYEPGRWEKARPVIAFGCLINDIQRFDMVLRRSQIDGDLHYIKEAESATKGLNKMLAIMEGEGDDVGIFVHQDMHFRQGWLPQVREQLAKLPDSWITAGIIGKALDGLICGKFRDMRIPLHFDTSEIHKFPQEACCFDECCIIVNLKKGFRFDESMQGWDLYGTLAVLQTWEMGGRSFILDAMAEHYCLRRFDWEPDELFKENYKWLHDRFKAMPRIDSTAIGEIREARRFETSAAA